MILLPDITVLTVPVSATVKSTLRGHVQEYGRANPKRWCRMQRPCFPVTLNAIVAPGEL